jgi:hypothetical protein
MELNKLANSIEKMNSLMKLKKFVDLIEKLVHYNFLYQPSICG